MVYQRLQNTSVEARTSVPEDIQNEYDSLLAEWTIIQELATNLRPSSDYSLQQQVFSKSQYT